MLLPACFSKPALRALRARWEPFLTALQHTWPFFTGALCASVAESILDPPSQLALTGVSGGRNISSSGTVGAGDRNLSLQWWLDTLLAQLLRGKPSRTVRYRISVGDGARLAACVADSRSRHAFGQRDTMAKLLEVCKRSKELDKRAAKGGVASMCSALGEAQEGAGALEGLDAVVLFELDAEMAALRGDAADLSGGGGGGSSVCAASGGASEATAAVIADAAAPVKQRMMSLEELERSMAGAEEDDDDEEEQEADDARVAAQRTDVSGMTHVTMGHDGWAVCEGWQPCPVGHLPGQSLLVGAGLGDLDNVLDQCASSAAAAHATAAHTTAAHATTAHAAAEHAAAEHAAAEHAAAEHAAAAPGPPASTLSTSIVFG